MLVNIALKSLWSRKSNLLLTLITLCISFTLIIAINHIQKEAKKHFISTVSGTDLIVGARSGPVNLLLYSVFRIGDATNNIRWDSYLKFAESKYTQWAIPISLGDSHRGYRVLGTTGDYFEYFKYGQSQSLLFKSGQRFKGVYEAVLGYEVAKKLKYQLNQKIILSHGTGHVGLTKHGDKPFKIVGILKPTGTPVDRTIHVSLAGIEAIHIDWQHGIQIPGRTISAEQALKKDLTPKSITAFYLGLKSKIATFKLSRKINQYRSEPLMAILPGATLARFWQILGFFEKILIVVSSLVVLSGFACMLSTLLMSLQQRRKEIILLRTIGFSPKTIIGLLLSEVLLLLSFSVLVSFGLLAIATILLQPFLLENFGILVTANFITQELIMLSGLFVGTGLLIAIIPVALLYKKGTMLSINL